MHAERQRRRAERDLRDPGQRRGVAIQRPAGSYRQQHRHCDRLRRSEQYAERFLHPDAGRARGCFGSNLERHFRLHRGRANRERWRPGGCRRHPHRVLQLDGDHQPSGDHRLEQQRIAGGGAVHAGGAGNFVPSHDQPWPANELERFEGMLVRVENGRVIANRPVRRYANRGRQHARLPRARDRVSRARAAATVWDGNPEIFEINPDAAGLARRAARRRHRDHGGRGPARVCVLATTRSGRPPSPTASRRCRAPCARARPASSRWAARTCCVSSTRRIDPDGRR